MMGMDKMGDMMGMCIKHKDKIGLIMLSKAKTLKGYKLDSLDGEIGKVKEFYFDDRHWTIRYLVADTGNWLTGRQVLISPYALVAVNPRRATHRHQFNQKADRGQSILGQ
jgi:hypothetical protein